MTLKQGFIVLNYFLRDWIQFDIIQFDIIQFDFLKFWLLPFAMDCCEYIHLKSFIIAKSYDINDNAYV